MPTLAHHGGDAVLRKVCLPAGDVGRSPCEPLIVARHRTIDSHTRISLRALFNGDGRNSTDAGLPGTTMNGWVFRQVSNWRCFRFHFRLTNRWPREYLNEIELRLRVVVHARYRQLNRSLYLRHSPAGICSVTRTHFVRDRRDPHFAVSVPSSRVHRSREMTSFNTKSTASSSGSGLTTGVDDDRRGVDHDDNLREITRNLNQSLIAGMAEGVCLQMANGEIAAINAAATRILGLDAEQIVGRANEGPLRGAVREDGSPFPEHLDPSKVTLRTGKPQTDVVMGIAGATGGLTWISVNSQPLTADGESSPYAVLTVPRGFETSPTESE